ncbi:LOW QUALITY PROTEIN: hypothetical protein TorRG33x02_281410 [Trema orientale]|uniref:Uncharacterized protein n=1 Tax=Trema orientale TaxID=63057 RepID=A0A2P5CKB4_TREOI|nr:LOW QUALITY PROTEIN: hypothetical protein TorRG33x02_281410 [Trema orientale]
MMFEICIILLIFMVHAEVNMAPAITAVPILTIQNNTM